MNRPVVCAYTYRDHPVRIEFMGPDYLLFVDDSQIGQFWLSALAADAEAQREIDRQEKLKETH